MGRAEKLKRTKPDSNSTFNSTTTYKSPLIKDNSSILKIKVLLAAWLVFKFWFYILLNYTPWKKKKTKSACATLRDAISFSSRESELPLDFSCYNDLSHDINDRRHSFQSRTCHNKIFQGRHIVKGILGCFVWGTLKTGFQDGVLTIPWKWGPVDTSQLETSESSSYIWKSHLCL